MLFPVTAFSLFACLIWSYRRYGRRDGLTLALSVWAVELVLISAPIFDYHVAYSFVADTFVAGCLLCTTLGYGIVRHRPRTAPSSSSQSSTEVSLAKALSVLGIAGNLLLLLDARSHGMRFNLTYLLDHLTVTRAAVFDNLAASATPTRMALLGSYLASCSFLSVMAAAHLGRSGGRTLILLASANGVLVAAASLFVYGGRSALFYAVGLVGVSLYVTGKRIVGVSPKRLLVAGLSLLCVWYFSVSWLQTREGRIDTASVLMSTQRASYSPWLASVASSDPTVGTGLLSLGYFVSPLPTLSFYIQRSPVPGPFWGAYSYPLPARIAAKLAGTYTAGQWFETRTKIFAPLESAGYAGNVWATWLRDLLVDFGYLGAVLYCGLFGVFMAWSRNMFELTGELHYHFLQVLACFTFAFGAFQSVVWFTYLANAFFIAIAITLAVRARPQTSASMSGAVR